MEQVNREKMDALINRDYDYLTKLESAILQLSHSENDEVFERSFDEHQSALQEQQQNLKDQIKIVKKTYNDRINDQNEQKSQQISSLIQLHQQQIQEFGEKWQSPNHLRNYSRPSTHLLQLRHIEKKQALSKLYMDAKATKMQADALQAEEEAQMQVAVEAEMRKEFSALRDRQLKELSVLSQHHDTIIEQLEQKKSNELKRLNLAQSKVNIKLTEPFNKAVHGRDKPSMTLRSEDLSTTSTLPTPRTQNRLLHFRGNRDAILNLKTIDAATLSRIKNSVNKEKRKTRSSLSSPIYSSRKKFFSPS